MTIDTKGHFAGAWISVRTMLNRTMACVACLVLGVFERQITSFEFLGTGIELAGVTGKGVGIFFPHEATRMRMGRMQQGFVIKGALQGRVVQDGATAWTLHALTRGDLSAR